MKMKVFILVFVAICCVAAVQATSADTKSIKKEKADDKITIGKVDVKDIKKQKDPECDSNESSEEREVKGKEAERIEKEKEVKEKEKKKEAKEKENERKEKEKEKEKEVKEKEKERTEKEDRKEKERKEKEREEKERKENDCRENDRKEKERKEKERKEKDKSNEKERKDKEKSKSKESKGRGNKSKENKDRNDNDECKGNKPNDNSFDKIKQIWKDRINRRPCVKPSEPVCPGICPFYEQPICAIPEGRWCGQPRTFSNPCFFADYNCKNPKNTYKYFHDGACVTTTTSAPQPECGLIDCPQESKPFCGLPNGFCGAPRTFENECLLEVYNCFNPNESYKYFHDGACITTTTSAPEPECGLIDCPQESKPFCGLPKDSCGAPRTFENKCLLEVYNCFNSNGQYDYFHDGACLTTPAPCVETASPNEEKKICGLPDGFCGATRSFANECYLKIYNAFNPDAKYKYFHDGECLNEPTNNCDSIMCTKEYFPFCARPDGFCGEILTFANACELDVYNCNNAGTKYRYFHEGECLTTPAPEPNCAALSCSNEGPAVCGLPDGFCGKPQTFTNGCNMYVYNCFNPKQQYKKFHDGKCLTDEPEPQCPTMCPAISRPICATPVDRCGEPKTFDNDCNLAINNCINPSDRYKLLHEGECIPQPKKCETQCPYNYEPICGTGQSGNVKTFPNRCDFDSFNCLNENNQFTFAYDGECNECADIKCNKIGQPVCATNSENTLQTFGNPCQLQQYNCDNCDDEYEFLYDGICAEPVICTKEYMPVCALSPTLGYTTFSNKCLRDAHIIQFPNEGYAPAYDGECKTECILGCPRNYAPVCAYDSKGNEVEYANKCLFDAYNCQNENNKHELAYESACNKCATGCIQIYDPVCSVDTNGVEYQFGNQCELDSHNCRNQNNLLSIKYAGECNNCKTACTREYRPVCTYNSEGNEKQWSNQCEMDSYNCRYPNDQTTLAYAGECNNCRAFCPKIYAPICAVNSDEKEQQFGNQCEFDNYNCRNQNNQLTVAYEGECHQCAIACIQLYDPVCAIDAGNNEKTWGNQCELTSYNCRYPYNPMTVVYPGECHQCTTMCAEIYQPVCTKDGAGNLKTWSNQCELTSYNCRYPYNLYTVQYQGECKPTKCLKPCPKILAEICAKDGNGNLKTFNNECELNNYNCQNPDAKYTKSSDGKCKPVCSDICPAIYKPVCGSRNGDCNSADAQTFSNQCALDAYNCRNPTKVLIKVADGECPKKQI